MSGWKPVHPNSIRTGPGGYTRRLLFLKSRPLVELVSALDRYESATAAIEALVPENERAQYTRALARLAKSEVIDAH